MISSLINIPFYSIATLVGGELLIRKDFIDILAYITIRAGKITMVCKL